MGKRKIELEFLFCNIIQREIFCEEEQELFDHINGHDVILSSGKKRCSNLMACNAKAIRCMYSMTNSNLDPFKVKRALPSRQRAKAGLMRAFLNWFQFTGAGGSAR